MKNPRKALHSHLSEIANGHLRATHKQVGTQTPVHCATYTYDQQRPLKTQAAVLGKAFVSLLEQAGFRHATEKNAQVSALYRTGLPLLKNEFLVAFHGTEGVRADLDIFSSDPSASRALAQATPDQIELAVAQTMGQLRMTS